VYKPIEVKVRTPDNEELTYRSYYLLMRGEEDRRPSPQYMDVIIRGACEHKLPPEYIDFLKGIEHNGYAGEIGITVPMCDKLVS
jgi:gamma-glutamylcyclotransferase